jgi:phosphoadenosine phosphosulfate reductase
MTPTTHTVAERQRQLPATERIAGSSPARVSNTPTGSNSMTTATAELGTDFTTLNASLEGQPPFNVLRWAARTFAPRLTLATAFNPEDLVLIDLAARHQLPIDLFTIDTGLLFPETYELWKRIEARYGITIRGVRPAQTVAQQAVTYGPKLWTSRPDQCCAVRKVAPLRDALAEFDAWVTGIRRDQSPARTNVPIVSADPITGLVKVSPLVSWSRATVDAYLAERKVPVNPLHAQGYPSIGCAPCTVAVAPGDDPRSGRWSGQAKTECGLHWVDGKPVRG